MISPIKDSNYLPRTMEIPDQPSTLSDWHKELFFQLPPTFKGNFISISYEAKVLHKHDAWNKIGEGTAIRFPISLH